MKNNFSKKFMIIGIVILFITILVCGSTFAYYVWSTDETSSTKIVTNVGTAYVYYDAGSSITGATLKPTASYTNGIKKTINIKSDVSIGLTLNLYLDINTLDAGLKEESFKYVLYKSGKISPIKEGNFSTDYLDSNLVTCSTNSTNHIVLLDNEILTESAVTYELYIWIDGTVDNPITMHSQNFSFNLHAEGENAILKEGVIPDLPNLEGTLAYNLIDTYRSATKTGVVNNGIIYYYDTTHNLMGDIDGNLRYYGKSPNNYIYFNCSDYSNQTSSTCELWRIIGVFDGKVKIIRNSSIGSYSWDNKNTSTGAEEAYGKNDWTSARLMKLLNPSDYYEVDANDNGLGQSLYYTGKSGTCYSGQNNVTKSCDFTSAGLKNDTTRNMIAEVTWNLGGNPVGSTSVYSDQIYEIERGTTVYSGRPTSWTGKVALTYPSDFGYAADFNSCALQLDSYNNSACNSVNWMKTILVTNQYSWFLTPHSNSPHSAWTLYTNATPSWGFGYSENKVVPVLYLNSNTIIELGDGSSSLPYKISVS